MTTAAQPDAKDRERVRAERGLRSCSAAGAAYSNRLPKPPHRRRPLLALLAVLLIVGHPNGSVGRALEECDVTLAPFTGPQIMAAFAQTGEYVPTIIRASSAGGGPWNGRDTTRKHASWRRCSPRGHARSIRCTTGSW